jgi:hypothetical protein
MTSSSTGSASSRRFPSKYSTAEGGLVTAQQWLAEFMTARQAAKAGVTLERGFWNTRPAWEKVLKHQIRHAASLLRLVPLEAVGNVLRSKAGNWLFSLANPKLLDLCREEARQLELKRAAAAALERPVEPAPPPTEDLPLTPRPSSMPTTRKKRGSLDKLDS